MSSKQVKTYHISELELAIQEAKDFGPVRAPSSYVGGPTIKVINSVKNRGLIQENQHFKVHGPNEEAVSLLLEFDPMVINYKPQPFRILMKINGEATSAIIDFLSWKKKSREEFVEAKAPKHLLSEETLYRLAAIEEILGNQGYSYKVLHADDTTKDPRYNNLHQLHRLNHSAHRSLEKTQAGLESIIRTLNNIGGHSTYDQLLKASPYISDESIAYGIFTGKISTSHRFPLGLYCDITLGADYE